MKRWTALTMLSDCHQHFLSSALLAGNARQLPRGKYRDELEQRTAVALVSDLLLAEKATGKVRF
jgi:hypothetical protein